MTTQAYSQIAVSGSDSYSFLQGQLSNDLERLQHESGFLAAWCNPKGRVICVPRVDRVADRYRLALPADMAEPVMRRLAMFRFRARVDFTIEDADIALLAGRDVANFDLASWRRANLENGIPEIAAAQSERYTPHMLNLDRLDAISLDKGCYTGQEVVARTHYRGATKRRMLRYDASAPVAAGDEVSAGERKAGDVVNAIGTALLAVVSLDFADDDLTIGDVRLSRAPLPYAIP